MNEMKQQPVFSTRWYWLQGLMIAASVIAAVLHWQNIPSTLTTHYNYRFQPDGYSAKSWNTVFMLNLVQICLLVGMMGINAIIARTKNGSASASDKGNGGHKEAMFRFVNSLFLYGLSLLLTLFFSFIQATMLYGWPVRVLPVVTIIVMLFILGSLAGLIGMVRRLGLQGPSSDPNEAHWLAGGIYYNPNDPAVFVPKKYGLGWTINFGRPTGWMVTGILILIPVAIVILIVLMT